LANPAAIKQEKKGTPASFGTSRKKRDGPE